VLNPKLALIGLLPTMVEPTPFQKANFLQVVQQYHPLMIRIGDGPGAFASIPRRSCIAEAQAEGAVLWEMKKTAARDAWREIEPSLVRIADIVTGAAPTTSRTEATMPLQLDDLAALDAEPDRWPATTAAAARCRHRRGRRPAAPRVRCQRPAGAVRDDPRARRASADLGAAESAGVGPLGAQLRRAPLRASKLAGWRRSRPSSTPPQTATTR
jgi:hypothetical protein